MAKEIGSDTDLPNFDDVNPPTIDHAAQVNVEAALAALDASYAPLMAAVKDADDARQALLSWAAIAEKVLNMVVPMVQGLIAQHSAVPAEEHPKRLQAFLQGLPGVALQPTTEARAAGFTSLLQGLLS